MDDLDEANEDSYIYPLNNFRIALGPMTKFIIRKHHAMRRFARYPDELERFRKELITTTSPEETHMILDLMEELRPDLSNLCSSDMWISAAPYSDCWTKVVNKKGEVIASITSFYICGGIIDTVLPDNTWGKRQCLRTRCSKDWIRKYQDPLEPYQAWYCSCGTKLGMNFEQIVQIKYPHDTVYIRANIPSWDIQDVRAKYYESEFRHCETPMELYHSVPVSFPKDVEVFEDDPMDRASKRVRPEIYASLPKMSWNAIFAMAEVYDEL